MSNLTPEGQRLVADIAQRNGFSTDAATSLLNSLSHGNGSQAQFNHHEFSGMGQWSQGGMIMIGDMFNQGLKYRVDALCNDLSNLLRNPQLWQPEPQSHSSQSERSGDGASLIVPRSGAGSWWPANLGSPGSTGSQNDMRYAYFPNARRLVLNVNGDIKVYDAGEHMISGFSQQQSGDQSVSFTSQHGLVRVADLAVVPTNEAAQVFSAAAQAQQTAPDSVPDPEASTPSHEASNPPSPTASHSTNSNPDVFMMLERLSELRQKNILSEDEYSAKKAELLSRL